MIDLLSIQPTVISKDLRGKYVMLYGKAKSGKTTAAAQFPKALLLAFEKGYNAIGGVMAQDITKWSEKIGLLFGNLKVINEVKNWNPEMGIRAEVIV